MSVKYKMEANDHVYNRKQIRRKNFYIMADVVDKMGREKKSVLLRNSTHIIHFLFAVINKLSRIC